MASQVPRSRVEGDEHRVNHVITDLEIAVGLPLGWSPRLGSLLKPGSLGRRWAMCEWFCSPVDEPFLQSSDFTDLLIAAGGPQTGPLPRSRWTMLRRLIGRPRRFSAAFLRVERESMVKARDEAISTMKKRGQSPELAWTRNLERLLAFHPLRREIVCATAAGIARGGVNVIFEGEKAKRCIPLADAMPAPAPPTPPDKFAPFTLEDLERIATLSALLRSKEACLDAITDLHDRAEAGGTVEQRDYAMRLLQLDEINKALVPALAAAVTPQMTSKVSAATIDREVLEILAQCNPPPVSPQVHALVLKCLQLCIAIRRVGTLRASPETKHHLPDAKAQLELALANLRPNEHAPAIVPYREIEAIVAALLR